MKGGNIFLNITPEIAWKKGTNIQTAYKHEPTATRAYLVMALGRLIEDVDANKTLRTDDELKFTCRAIMEEHPTMKVEEIALAFDYIRMGKFGKLYERLKTAEILEALRRYEGEIRTIYIESQIHNEQSFKNEINIMPENIVQDLRESLSTNTDPPKGEGIGTRLRKQFDNYSKEEENE